MGGIVGGGSVVVGGLVLGAGLSVVEKSVTPRSKFLPILFTKFGAMLFALLPPNAELCGAFGFQSGNFFSFF